LPTTNNHHYLIHPSKSSEAHFTVSFHLSLNILLVLTILSPSSLGIAMLKPFSPRFLDPLPTLLSAASVSELKTADLSHSTGFPVTTVACCLMLDSSFCWLVD
jgi:hypothetical protein